MQVVSDNGKLNPILKITSEEVLDFIRSKIKDSPYADRELLAVQITVEHEFQAGVNYHHETPSLVIMLSNIKKSDATR